MLKKKGSILTVNELIPFLIAIAIVVLLAIFVGHLLLNWDVSKEASESSLDKLKIGVATADQGGTGSYFLFDGKKDDLSYYLVYFGVKNTFDEMFNGFKQSFVFLGKNVNRICVCYGESKETYCLSCMNLDHPAKFEGKEGPWAAASDQQIEIKLVGEVYEFVVKK